VKQFRALGEKKGAAGIVWSVLGWKNSAVAARIKTARAN